MTIFLILSLVFNVGALASLFAWLFERQKRRLYERRSLELNDLLQQAQIQKNDLHHELLRLQIEYQHAQQSQEEKITWQKLAREELQASFQQASQVVLTQSQTSLLQLAESRFLLLQNKQEQALEDKRKAMQDLLSPIKQSLEQLESERKREGQQWHQTYGALHEALRQGQSQTQLLQKETHGLAQALKASHVRGVWGEMQLQRIVELAGMTAYCDFTPQKTLEKNGQEHESIKRPDLIVHLPAGRHLAIDAKAPLKAYLESLEDISREDQKRKIEEHARQLKQHIQALSQKQYWKNLESCDFVILFVPGDIFLHHALIEIPDLLDWAAQRHILLATPTSLIALLKSCAYSWHQTKLQAQVEQIITSGKELYTRLSCFCEHFEDLRKNLDRSVHSFNNLVGSWQNRVLSSAKRLQELDLHQTDLHEINPLDTIPRQARPTNVIPH